MFRGGSWYDRPKRCTASYRYGYRSYQKAYNVGFRIIATRRHAGGNVVALKK